MGYFNENKAYIKGNGNLTLGYNHDDAAYHSTYTWAKDDIFIPVPLSTLMITETTTSDLWITIGQTDAVTSSAAGAVGQIPTLMVDENSKAYAILATLQPPVGYRTLSTITDAQGKSNSVPHGAMLLDVAFTYRPVTAAISSFTCVFFTELMPIAAASGAATGEARATQAAYGGTVLYEQPIGTACAAASLKVDPPSTAANYYTVKAKPTTPAFINTDYTSLYFQVNATTGAGDFEIGQMIAHWAVALY